MVKKVGMVETVVMVEAAEMIKRGRNGGVELSLW